MALVEFSSEMSAVLVVVAHPDDAEFQFGGTVSRCTSLGIAVHYLICTSGELGSEDATASKESIIELRQREQRDAASALGVTSVEFLDYADGMVRSDLDLRIAIARRIRETRPELVLTHFAERSYEFPIGASHPDHLAVGEACLQAVYPDARSTRSLSGLEDLAPHFVEEVWVPALSKATVAVDVTEHTERKIDALLRHRSQHGPEPRRSVAWVEARLEALGERFGVPCAEAFFAIATGSATAIVRHDN